MIGHYLLTLTQEQEDRVLTQQFEGFHGLYLTTKPCLIQVTEPRFRNQAFAAEAFMGKHDSFGRIQSPANRYDRLTVRFGETRINAAIRNRILSNQARRALGMEIGETRRIVKVTPEPVPMTPVAPHEPTPERVPVLVPA